MLRSALAALVRNRAMGSRSVVGGAHLLTAGSRRASRHRSTSGKRDGAGRAAVSAEVAWLQDVRMWGVADAGWGEAGVAKRDLRYGATVLVRVCLT